MILYKLTDENGYTRAGESNACLWGENVSHSGTGKGMLCTEGWIHAYTSPLLAVLLNPIHADIENPRLWEAQGVVEKSDKGLKVGCKTLTTIREIPLPEISSNQRIAFAILCTKEVCQDKKWNLWADKWLSGEGRSPSLVGIVANTAYYAAHVAAPVANAAASAARAAHAADSTLNLISIADKAMEY